MSSLGRCALLLVCAAIGCDDADGFSNGPRDPANPTSSSSAGGQTGDGDTSAGTGDGGTSGEASEGGTSGEAGDGGQRGSQAEPNGGVASAVCPQRPWVLTSELVNARDVGGTPLSQGGNVVCGSIFRGPPLTLTPAGCEQARALGLRTVIDLRVEYERSAVPDSQCVGADFVLTPLPVPYGLAAADYLADLNADTIATVFHTFGDPERYPIYFHCTWGRDRTGVVAALLLLTLGASEEDVMAEYLLSRASVGAYPNALQAVLAEIAARGGPERFLTGIGISREEIAVIRSHAVD